MKKLYFLCFYILTSFSYGQKIKGTAIDSSNEENKVYITINDTLKKITLEYYNQEYYKNFYAIDINKKLDLRKYRIYQANYKKLSENKKLNKKVTNKNKFKIKAKKTDSLTFRSPKHIPQSFLVSNLSKKEKLDIKLEPIITKKCKKSESKPCIENKSKLYAFIGERIKITRAKRKPYCGKDVRMKFDNKFNAKYRIIEDLYGNYKKDTIDFVIYGHYSEPGFSKYDNVILYVKESCGILTQVRYTFNDVYKTTDGKWASPYQGFDLKKTDSLNLKNQSKWNLMMK